MEQDRNGSPVEGSLTIVVDGVVRWRLAPKDPRLTFGRAREGPSHLHIGPPGSHDDCALSRTAGSVRCHDGQWILRNESEIKPFVVVVRGHEIPIAPRMPARSSQWAIGPEPVVVELTTPTGTYEIEFRPHPPPGTSEPCIPPDSERSTDLPAPEPTPYQRVVLAAKFLSRRRPGAAVGDACAADRATRALRHGHVVTAKAVENIVGSWRGRLEKQGYRDVSGRRNVDRVGELLLAHGVISEVDRLDLELVEDDDPRA